MHQLSSHGIWLRPRVKPPQNLNNNIILQISCCSILLLLDTTSQVEARYDHLPILQLGWLERVMLISSKTFQNSSILVKWQKQALGLRKVPKKNTLNECFSSQGSLYILPVWVNVRLLNHSKWVSGLYCIYLVIVRGKRLHKKQIQENIDLVMFSSIHYAFELINVSLLTSAWPRNLIK